MHKLVAPLMIHYKSGEPEIKNLFPPETITFGTKF
jgi:hypothetical protein